MDDRLNIKYVLGINHAFMSLLTIINYIYTTIVCANVSHPATSMEQRRFITYPSKKARSQAEKGGGRNKNNNNTNIRFTSIQRSVVDPYRPMSILQDQGSL